MNIPGLSTSLVSNGNFEIFILKLDKSSGNAIYAKSIGGTVADYALKVQADSKGNIVVCGQFYGFVSSPVDFDPGPGQFLLSGAADIFIAKFDSAGNFLWAKSNYESAPGAYDKGVFCFDQNDNVYTFGQFAKKIDFNTGIGELILDGENGGFFLQKHDEYGNFLWVKQFGNDFEASPEEIISKNNNIYITGWYRNLADFNPDTAVADVITSNGERDIFIANFDTSGTLNWAHGMGNADFDNGYAIFMDEEGNLLVTGTYQQSVDFDPSGSNFYLSNPNISSSSAFILKLKTQTSSIITDNDADSLIKISPNPTDDQLYIEIFDLGNIYKNIFIFDFTGKILFSHPVSTQQFIVNTLNFPQGIYIIAFENSAGQRIFKKMIKS